MAVQLSDLHKVAQGKETMDEIKPREFEFGNTRVVVHSKLAWMTSEERKEWYEREWEKGNPILKQIARAALRCRESGE